MPAVTAQLAADISSLLDT